jgi:outer membrane protein assembly factor BamB
MRDRRRALLAGLALALALSPSLGAAGPSWPQYRGPNRDGISPEIGLAGSWPAGGPAVLWRVPVGEGYSGMAVADGRLFTAYASGADEVLVAHDAATGKELWRLRLDRVWTDGQGNGPRSTPTVDGDLVYGLSARGNLVAANAATGAVAWRHDLAAEVGAEPPQWGISTSPVVEGDLLVVDAGGKAGFGLVAYDKKTGVQRWASESGGAGYSLPIRAGVDGVEQLIVFRATGLVAINPKDGKAWWRYPWRTDWDVNAAAPLFVPPNRLFVSSGYSTGAALLQIRVDDGRPSASEVWSSKAMKNQFSSSIARGGHVYGFDNRVFKCLDLNTGAEKWKQSGLGQGSLVYADGKLYVLAEDGRLVMAAARSEAYVEMGTFQALTGKSWTAPSLVDGRLYVRNQKEMACLNVREGV